MTRYRDLVWWYGRLRLRILRDRLHRTTLGRAIGRRIGHPYSISGVIIGKDLGRLIDILTRDIPDYSKPTSPRRRYRR